MVGIVPAGAIPGHREIDESGEVQVWKPGEGFPGYFVLSSDVVLAKTNTDTGNTGDTTVLRGGNLIGTETSLGNEYIYDEDANDGTQTAWGILLKHQPMLENGTAVNKVLVPIMTHGVYRRSQIIGLDAQAESQLAQRGLFADSAPQGAAALVHPMRVSRKSAAYTLVAADNGTLFLSTNTSDQTFTLPTIAVGLSFQFLAVTAKDIVVTGDNNILGLAGIAHSTITSDDQIGAHVRVLAVYIDGSATLKWIVEVLAGTFVYAG